MPSPAVLKITSATFHTGEVGVSYTPVTLKATGGVTPYTWSVSAGAITAGLAISANGTVSGTPKTSGTFHFTLQVTDAGGGKVSVPKSFAIIAGPHASLIPACVQACYVEVGCVTVCGRFGNVSGGTPPYKYAFQQGYIPTGTALAGLSLTGTFKAPANRWQFTVAVTDSLGATTSVSPSFYVFPHIALANGTCSISLLLTCTVQLRYSGGVPGKLPTVKSTTWTPGCDYKIYPAVCAPQPTFAVAYQTGLVTITLTDSQSWSGPSSTLGLLITDKSLCGPSVFCTAKATLTVA